MHKSDDIPEEIYSLKYTPLSKRELKILIVKAKAGDNKAMQRIVQSILRFVLKYIRRARFHSECYTNNDFFNIATIGVINAVHGFDINYENSFITYARWHIMAIINRYLQIDNLVKMPRAWRYIRYMYKAEAYNGEVDLDEFSERIKVPKSRIEKFLKNDIQVCDLSPSEDDDMQDSVYENQPDPKDHFQKLYSDYDSDKILNELEDRDREIIKMRYGLPPYYKEHSYREIGLVYDISHEAIRQRVVKSLEKLKAVIKRFNINKTGELP